MYHLCPGCEVETFGERLCPDCQLALTYRGDANDEQSCRDPETTPALDVPLFLEPGRKLWAWRHSSVTAMAVLIS